MVDADTALIVARVMRETALVAREYGVTLQDKGFCSAEFVSASENAPVKMVQAYGETIRAEAPQFRQSILQYANRGRRLEVAETLGYTLEPGSRLGVPAPTLELCCRVLGTVSRAAGNV
jgi:ketopantoate reductase